MTHPARSYRPWPGLLALCLAALLPGLVLASETGGTPHDFTDHWAGWLRQRGGTKIAAPQQLGNDDAPILVDAPGTYVVE